MKKDSIDITPRTTELDKVIGAEIKRRREASKLSQDDLADKMGISKTLLFFLEKGERSWNSTTISAALGFFNISLAELAGGSFLSDQDTKDLELIRAHRAASENFDKAKARLKSAPKKKPKN